MKIVPLLLALLFLGCKSKEPRDSELIQESYKSLDLTKKVYNVRDSYGEGIRNKSVLTLEEFLIDRTLNEQQPMVKKINNEIGDEYLVCRHFSGGAHCCTVTEILFEDEEKGEYIIIYKYSEDGDIYDISYPLFYNEYYNYFYSTYAATDNLNCNTEIKPGYYLLKKNVKKGYEGNRETYLECFKKYLLDSSIPELNSNNEDNGERELILNSINLLRISNISLDELLNIYISYSNFFRDKEKLWMEMLEVMGVTDKKLIKRHKEILESQTKIINDRELLRLYYKYKNLESENFVTTSGEISFTNTDFQFYLIPESEKIAYIRIGKTQSIERSEVIEAFLNEAINAKTKNGYKQYVLNKETTKYGSIEKKEFRKGDLYICTYFEYERVQGTYNSKSYVYTYYVELGSVDSREKFIEGDYSLKLGE